jgi:DNA-directed RNA polymerase specialized sigma24 family protein
MPNDPLSEPSSSDLDAFRPLMFSIAYRMLGSITEAEDIVQEASLRFHGPRPTVSRSR